MVCLVKKKNHYGEEIVGEEDGGTDSPYNVISHLTFMNKKRANLAIQEGHPKLNLSFLTVFMNFILFALFRAFSLYRNKVSPL